MEVEESLTPVRSACQKTLRCIGLHELGKD
jgi:hypothetical protein